MKDCVKNRDGHLNCGYSQVQSPKRYQYHGERHYSNNNDNNGQQMGEVLVQDTTPKV